MLKNNIHQNRAKGEHLGHNLGPVNKQKRKHGLNCTRATHFLVGRGESASEK